MVSVIKNFDIYQHNYIPLEIVGNTIKGMNFKWIIKLRINLFYWMMPFLFVWFMQYCYICVVV